MSVVIAHKLQMQYVEMGVKQLSILLISCILMSLNSGGGVEPSIPVVPYDFISMQA